MNILNVTEHVGLKSAREQFGVRRSSVFTEHFHRKFRVGFGVFNTFEGRHQEFLQGLRPVPDERIGGGQGGTRVAEFNSRQVEEFPIPHLLSLVEGRRRKESPLNNPLLHEQKVFRHASSLDHLNVLGRIQTPLTYRLLQSQIGQRTKTGHAKGFSFYVLWTGDVRRRNQAHGNHINGGSDELHL